MKIQWKDPEPMASGGEQMTSECGRFRIYKSVLGGEYAVGYRATEFSIWKPIDPLHGGQTRWHRRRKSALEVVESFAEKYKGTEKFSESQSSTRKLVGIHDEHNCGGRVYMISTVSYSERFCDKCGQTSHYHWKHPITGKLMPPQSPICEGDDVVSPVSETSISRSIQMSENNTNNINENNDEGDTIVVTAPKKKARKVKAASATETKVTTKKKATKKAAVATKDTKKRTKGKKAKGKAENNGAPRRRDDSGLTGNQRKVLEILARNSKPLTRNDLREKTGINKGWSKMLGTAENPAEDSLEGMGLIKHEEQEGERSLLYSVTAAGKKAVAK